MSFNKTWKKSFGISNAGPVPNTLLAGQDLEGKKEKSMSDEQLKGAIKQMIEANMPESEIMTDLMGQGVTGPQILKVLSQAIKEVEGTEKSIDSKKELVADVRAAQKKEMEARKSSCNGTGFEPVEEKALSFKSAWKKNISDYNSKKTRKSITKARGRNMGQNFNYKGWDIEIYEPQGMYLYWTWIASEGNSEIGDDEGGELGDYSNALKYIKQRIDKEVITTKSLGLSRNVKDLLDEESNHVEGKCGYGHQSEAKKMLNTVLDRESKWFKDSYEGNEFNLVQDIEQYLNDTCKFYNKSTTKSFKQTWVKKDK